MIYGWYGRGNLGDDAMKSVIEKEFADSKFDFICGGTILTPGGMYEFIDKVENPENTIIFSLGVADSWNKNIDPDKQYEHQRIIDKLRRFKRIYTRDYYSHIRLNELSIDNILSVDLLCYFLPKSKPNNDKYANIIKTITEFSPYHNQAVDMMYRDGYKLFAMSKDHDIGKVYTDAQEVVDMLHGATVIATRLHANVLAWMAGAKITPIAYDRKVINFYERVAFLTPKEAHDIIIGHINEVKKL